MFRGDDDAAVGGGWPATMTLRQSEKGIRTMWLCRHPSARCSLLRISGQGQGGSASPAREEGQETGQLSRDRSRGRAGSSASRCLWCWRVLGAMPMLCGWSQMFQGGTDGLSQCTDVSLSVGGDDAYSRSDFRAQARSGQAAQFGVVPTVRTWSSSNFDCTLPRPFYAQKRQCPAGGA